MQLGPDADGDAIPESFLDDDCGRNALQLASRGSAIIATLQRLAAHIPSEFVSPASSSYSQIVFDFRYFKSQDSIEKKIADTAELLAQDKEFYDTHIELLESFMGLFRSIYGYVTELNRFIRDIQDGQYVAQTLDSILDSVDGRQLLCELYHLYGVMLLLLDHRIGGQVRERLIVSYIRYRGSGEAHTVEVAELCRSTEDEARSSSSPRPSSPSPTERGYQSGGGSTYPLRFFERVPVQKGVVGRLLACLRSDDIYRMAGHYPNPEHRSAAMALQGGIVYVLLFFCGDVLTHQLPVMKEVVEKHFADNWVVHYYAGYTADLATTWAAFPAACDALQRTLESRNVTYHVQLMRSMLSRSTERVQAVLQEGVLTESYVLDNVHAALLPIITEANVVLRWFIVHTVCATAGEPRASSPLAASASALCAAAADAECLIRSAVTNDELLTLLLATAQLEYHVQSRFACCCGRSRRGGRLPSGRPSPKPGSCRTFSRRTTCWTRRRRTTSSSTGSTRCRERISGLHMKQHDATATRRKLQRLIAALENIQEFDQVNQQLQVLQFVRETCADLHQMLRYMNAERRVLGRLATVTDLSYAWESFSARGFLVRELQARIQSQPVVAAQMRALFVKLSSLLHLPCIRIDQGIAVGCVSIDNRLERALTYTATFYSEEVVAFLRSVLQVIPTSIFEVLQKVMYLLTHTLQECPSKLQRDEWRRWSQLDTREQLSAYTADIARYAAGLLAMEETTVGVVRVNPHQLLEDGIRRELVEHITRELHSGIWFDRARASTVEQLDKELAHLGSRLRGVRNSFEYIQDFVNVHGLQIWMEEFQRVVRFTVQMECNAFWPKKVYPWNSPFQSASIPIPYFAPTHPRDAYSFLGHLVQHLLYLTSPTEALYFPAYGAWFTRRRLCESVGPRLFSRVAEAVDCVGLTCLDELLSLLVTKEMQLLALRFAESVVQGGASGRALLHEAWVLLMPPVATPPADAFVRVYDQLASLFGNTSAIREVEVVLMRVGRIVLMRELIAHQLRSDSRQDSALLVNCVDAVNTALHATLETHLGGVVGPAAAAQRRVPCADVPDALLCEAAPLCASVGLSDAASTVYDVADGSTAAGSAVGSGAAAGGGGGVVKATGAAASAAPSASAVATSVAVPATMALPLFVLPLCVTVLLNVQHTTYSPQFDSCIPALKSDDVDATVLAVGVASLLQQFPAEATRLVMQLLAQVTRVAATVSSGGSAGAKADARDATSLVRRCAAVLPMWMTVLAGYLGRFSEVEMAHLVPPGAFDAYLYPAKATASQAAQKK